MPLQCLKYIEPQYMYLPWMEHICLNICYMIANWPNILNLGRIYLPNILNLGRVYLPNTLHQKVSPEWKERLFEGSCRQSWTPPRTLGALPTGVSSDKKFLQKYQNWTLFENDMIMTWKAWKLQSNRTQHRGQIWGFKFTTNIESPSLGSGFFEERRLSAVPSWK